MRILISAMTVMALILCGASPPSAVAAPSSAVKRDFQLLPKPGEKVPLGATHYFTYGFAKQPKLGTVVMRVEIFRNDGIRAGETLTCLP